jgi:hypothetical protein
MFHQEVGLSAPKEFPSSHLPADIRIAIRRRIIRIPIRDSRIRAIIQIASCKERLPPGSRLVRTTARVLRKAF